MKKVNLKNKSSNVGEKIALIIGIIYLGLVVVGISCIFLLVNIGNNDVIIDETNTEIIIDGGEITISKPFNNFYDAANNIYYVTGNLKNNLDSQISDISITFKMYDCANNVLGTSYSFIDSLDSKEVWKFKAIYSDIDANEVCSYKYVSSDYYAWD